MLGPREQQVFQPDVHISLELPNIDSLPVPKIVHYCPFAPEPYCELSYQGVRDELIIILRSPDAQDALDSRYPPQNVYSVSSIQSTVRISLAQSHLGKGTITLSYFAVLSSKRIEFLGEHQIELDSR
jgi:hypothetical protein